MEYYLQKDKQFTTALKVMKIIYLVAGVALLVRGIINRSTYEILQSIGTYLLVPLLYAVRRIFHWVGGVQMEFYIYVFSFLGWSLGCAGEFFDGVPYYDKLVHTLSGVFVSMLALVMFRLLDRPCEDRNKHRLFQTLFLLFTSMAVAGMFEFCEYGLSPIMGRDMQHVMETGVSDTMQDMLVCLVGTIFTMIVTQRSFRGKHDFVTDAAEAFIQQNTLPGKTH